MTKTELRKAKAELKRLNAFIAKHDKAKGFEITENVKNTEAFGERYVFVSIPKEAVELRKRLKAIRWGANARGKARWNKDLVAWSCLADGLKGTEFGS